MKYINVESWPINYSPAVGHYNGPTDGLPKAPFDVRARFVFLKALQIFFLNHARP